MDAKRLIRIGDLCKTVVPKMKFLIQLRIGFVSTNRFINKSFVSKHIFNVHHIPHVVGLRCTFDYIKSFRSSLGVEY